MKFTPPFGYFLMYERYRNTIVKVSNEYFRHGWKYFAGHFHDGTPFYQLGERFFDQPSIDFEDLDDFEFPADCFA